jgi:hypothetical protein
MAGLFETTELNGMKTKNRFVRSATYEAMAGLDGAVEPFNQENSFHPELAHQNLKRGKSTTERLPKPSKKNKDSSYSSGRISVV